jgi:hypothetical protein
MHLQKLQFLAPKSLKKLNRLQNTASRQIASATMSIAPHGHSTFSSETTSTRAAKAPRSAVFAIETGLFSIFEAVSRLAPQVNAAGARATRGRGVNLRRTWSDARPTPANERIRASWRARMRNRRALRRWRKKANNRRPPTRFQTVGDPRFPDPFAAQKASKRVMPPVDLSLGSRGERRNKSPAGSIP